MDNLRFVLVVTFAMLVVLMMQAWQIDYGPKPATVAAVTTPNLEASHEDLPATGAPAVASTSSPVPGLSTSGKIITVKTDVIDLEIDLQGGTIRSMDLLQYPTEQDNSVVNKARALIGLPVSEKNHAPVRLFNNEPEKQFIAQSGLIADNGAIANHYSIFTTSQDSYRLDAGQDTLTVPMIWTDNSGLSVTKSFTFKRGSYDIALNQHIDNASGKPWVIRQYSQLLRVPDHSNKGNFMMGGMRAYDGGVIYTEKDKYKKISYDDMQEGNLDVGTQGGWTAFIKHYFASAWIPPADQENHFYTKSLASEHYVIGSYSPLVTVDNNAAADFTSQLYAGPKVQPVMEKVAKGLELTVDYSVLTFIGKPIYWLLNQIHDLTGNWGVAIMGVTLCIKLLFFPLSQASFKSMAKMRKIQPRLKELQERFKDDRQRFNTEMMALYKKEKANPLGGCFPVLIQIPVFMCLYWVLSETVEFRQAPFMLWIQDLSVEDPFYILPIIMGITMKIQQGLNPAPIDPIQARVMKMFPLVFTVFFLFFPAGLVLYWVVNNTLSILQQWYITKTIANEP
ncbi:membrane protein insertase YidC [Methylovulum psychrotolerans]|uniref:membrane protein insertase YidC n=1 Tax=Methylovulum psychrotolerans TaxID=1704499 RepID=UPI001BFF492F|nr:membrane protein insertase YidC [Methylovulum psychrotolerans]MBT9099402.1 membrane protein insertase YidC [Methylovulum psychrotolerans]